MADPRAFVSFDFDHDETAKNTVCWASEEFEDPLFNTRLVGEIFDATGSMGSNRQRENKQVQHAYCLGW